MGTSKAIINQEIDPSAAWERETRKYVKAVRRIRYRKQLLRDKAKKRTANAATEGNGPEQHLTSERKKDHRAPRLGACALVQPCDEDASTGRSACFLGGLWMGHPGKGTDQRRTPVKDHQNRQGPGGRGWSRFSYGYPPLKKGCFWYGWASFG